MNMPVTEAMSAAAGVFTAGYLAKLVLNRALNDLRLVAAKVNDIEVKLSGVAVKLDQMHEYRETLKEHDRKITALESRSKRRA